VHISERTLSYLDNHFEVEAAHGEKKEEALRMAGLKTFFIVKALTPFVEEPETRNGSAGEETKLEENSTQSNGTNGDSVVSVNFFFVLLVGFYRVYLTEIQS
jgi:hypothetical protein